MFHSSMDSNYVSDDLSNLLFKFEESDSSELTKEASTQTTIPDAIIKHYKHFTSKLLNFWERGGFGAFDPSIMDDSDIRNLMQSALQKKILFLDFMHAWEAMSDSDKSLMIRCTLQYWDS